MKIKYLDPDYYERKYGLFADDEGEGGEAGAAGAEGGEEGADGASEAEGDGKPKESGKGAEAASEGAEGTDKETGKDGAEGAEGDQAQWRDAIGDEKLKEHAERFNTLEDLVKGHAELRQTLSKAIIPPGKDASEEEVAAYRKKIGVPESADKYEFETPEDYELTDDDKAFRSWAGEVFFANNVPLDAAKNISKAWNQLLEKQAEDAQAADKKYADEAEEALKHEWGADYDRNKTFSNRAAAQLLGEDLDAAREIETKDGRFVLDHPIMVKMLARVGREMAEDRLGGVMSESQKDTINGQIDDLQKQIEDAQSKGNTRQANDLYQRKLGLIAKRDGERPVVGAEGRAA